MPMEISHPLPSNKSHSTRRLIRVWASGAVTLSLFTLAIPSKPVAAIQRMNDFQICASQLVNARITPPAAADACATALYPRDLTICVTKINERTNIAPGDALATCRQVRRPRDLARCVINISIRAQGAAGRDVLDNCRRSLLPIRFSECVVGLNREIDISAAQAMATCIDASDKPRDFYPPIPRPDNLSPNEPSIVPVPLEPNFRK